jgi:hypothetical protein
MNQWVDDIFNAKIAKRDGAPPRLLPWFVIGEHAMVVGDCS